MIFREINMRKQRKKLTKNMESYHRSKSDEPVKSKFHQAPSRGNGERDNRK